MTTIYTPDPADVPFAPELPTLSILDAALVATIHVLRFQHDLEIEDGLAAKVATNIVRDAEHLRTLVWRYAEVVLGDE